MKNIETLVEDIYNLFSNQSEWSPNKNNIETFGKRLSEHIASRASEQRGAPYLRLSNLGMPDRKLWFTINRPELSEPLPPEVKIKFLFGDILEELLLFLASEAGHTVEGEQSQVEVNGVKGSIDAIIDGHLIDCKSASSYSFNKFKTNGLRQDDPFGYLSQLGSYLFASKNDSKLKEKDKASFLVIDKQLGKITLDTYTKSEEDFDKIVDQKRKVLESKTPPEEKCYPLKPEGKSGNLKLDTGCSYCPFKWDCWDGLRGFIYSSGPVYLGETVVEPRVTEIDRHNNVVPKEF